VSATIKIVSDDPKYEICYGLAVLFNFDEAVQINPHFNHFKIYSSETTEPNLIKHFSWDNPSVGLFQNCNRQPRSPSNIGTLTKIEISIIDLYYFKLK
jgi:hypothetical protein